MGGLFSSFKGKKLPNNYIDFDSAAPGNEEETQIVGDFNANIVTPSTQLVQRLQGYIDAGGVIATAISQNTPENVNVAWEAVLPNIHFQEEIFNFASVLMDNFTSLLDYVLNLLNGNGIEILDQHAAVTKSFADCFDIILKLDEVVLGLPKLLNDLAFFRRNASRRPDSESYEVLLQKSSEITMFFGMSNPLLSRAISTLQSRYGGDDAKIAQILSIFASAIDICAATLVHQNVERQETKILLLRCITGATLMYDHISSNGAFNKSVPFAIMDAMKQVANFQPKQAALINAIKFSSKHLEDPSTIPQVHDLFSQK